MTKSTNSIDLNGQDFELLPLNWKQLGELRAQVIVINNMDPSKGLFSEEEMSGILTVVTASLNRKRPDIQESFVAEHLDLGNVGDILKMVFGQKLTNHSKAVQSTGEAGAAISQT